MRKIFLPFVFTLICSMSFADQITQIQSFLNRLDYDAGSVDGIYGKKTNAALVSFYKSFGGVFDGSAGKNEVDDLRSALIALGQKITPIAGFEIENHSKPLIFPPWRPGITQKKYRGGYFWVDRDFNNDGLNDFLIVGELHPSNIDWKFTAGGLCGGGDCKGNAYGPTLYLQQSNGTFLDHSDLIKDNRKKPGMNLARQILTGDFNGDGTTDIFIADTGFASRGSDAGSVDSYYLSVGDGTWQERSHDKLKKPGLSLFNHGATTGDIDNDGDLDIALTSLKGKIFCLMNDGTGFLSPRQCASSATNAIELGDIDGDGDLDLVHTGDERGRKQNPAVILNNGRGKFSRSIELPTVKGNWKGGPELSLWDLDNDGDLDIVISRHGYLYVGTGIQLIENLGSLKFRSQFLPLIEAPVKFQKNVKREGNEWNQFVDNIRFSDVDLDGDFDVVLNSDLWRDRSKKIRASILLNEGNFKFRHIPNGKQGNPVKVLGSKLFVSPPEAYEALLQKDSHIPTSLKPKQTKASKSFSQFLKTAKIPEFDDSPFQAYPNPILFLQSGALITHASKPRIFKKFALIDLLVNWGNEIFPVTVSAQHYDHGFTGYRASFKKGVALIDQQIMGFGQIKELETLVRKDCKVLNCFFGHWEDAWKNGSIKDTHGIKVFLEDLHNIGPEIFLQHPSLTKEEKVDFKTNF